MADQNNLRAAALALESVAESSLDYRPEFRHALANLHVALHRAATPAVPAPDVGGLTEWQDFVQAAQDFADAHIACDEIEAMDDFDPDAVAESEFHKRNDRYNLTKARLIAARRSNLAAPAATSEPDEPTDREQLIACLGDDAATLIAQNPDDEMAQTMLDAAAMLEATSEQMGGAQAATLSCPQCGVDRLKEPCPGTGDDCAMVADAHLLATTESTAAPADLSEYWQAGFDGKEICPTTRGSALAAYSEGLKARAATSERKPLTSEEMWQVAANEQGTQLDCMKCEVIVLECPADVRDLYRAIERQHHGIGGDK